MNPFPPAYPQLTAAPTLGYRPVGAVTLTADLQAAATNLVQKVNAGCLASPFDECSSFQQAYNNAGGNISLDGLYGPETKAALQSILDSMGQGFQAPAACVAGAAGSVVPALTPTVPAASPNVLSTWLAPGATVNLPVVGAVSTSSLIVGAAAIFATWLVGSALWKAYHEGGHGIHHAPTKARRRRNPVKRRRVREKARQRAERMTRDPSTGRFKRG
jgi:hypothetical protein